MTADEAEVTALARAIEDAHLPLEDWQRPAGFARAILATGLRVMSGADKAALTEACDKRGLPHGLAGLIRHIENNAAATIGGWKLAAETAKERMEAAEARPSCTPDERALLDALERLPWRQYAVTIMQRRDDQWLVRIEYGSDGPDAYYEPVTFTGSTLTAALVAATEQP